MTTPNDYFETSGERPSSLAQRMGISPSTITRALKGERDPSMDLARAIETATNGQVSALEFLDACLTARPAPSTEAAA